MSAANKFRENFEAKNINYIFNTKLLGTRAIGLDRIDPRNFEEKLEDECQIISRKVLAGTYYFTRYKEKLVSKGAGKPPRQLSIPTIRDRLTLRTLCEVLFLLFPNSKPPLPQDRISSVCDAINTKKYTHFIKIDLKEFYPSIDHQLMMKKLHHKIRIPEFKSLILKAIKNPTISSNSTMSAPDNNKGVSQGLSISNVLAEIYMQDVDIKLQNLCPEYFRFVDDIVMLTTKNPQEICLQACEILRKAKLNPHDVDSSGSKTKTGPLSEGFDFLGYDLKPSTIRCKKSSILNFESSLVEVFAEYKHRLRISKNEIDRSIALYRFRWSLNLKLTGCIYKKQRYGWVFYYSQINDMTVFRRIDNTIKKLYIRFNIPCPPKPKNILKSFYESKRTDKESHRYIPNYDTLSIDKIKDFLEKIGHSTKELNEVEVSLFFHRLIRRATRKLEKDIGNIS